MPRTPTGGLISTPHRRGSTRCGVNVACLMRHFSPDGVGVPPSGAFFWSRLPARRSAPCMGVLQVAGLSSDHNPPPKCGVRSQQALSYPASPLHSWRDNGETPATATRLHRSSQIQEARVRGVSPFPYRVGVKLLTRKGTRSTKHIMSGLLNALCRSYTEAPTLR